METNEAVNGSALETVSEYSGKDNQKVFPSDSETEVETVVLQKEDDVVEVFNAPTGATAVVGGTPIESERTEPSEQNGKVEEAEFSLDSETGRKLPQDKGFRFLFWNSWGFILVAIVILIVGIIWISVCKGTTFGAYAPLLFIAAFIMAGISVLNIILLCRFPNQVFCHGVLALVTFLIFLALLILGVVVGGFHFFTINMEYAIFKMDFDLYEEKLKLDTFEKIKKVDDSYFWMALAFGITIGVILLATFVLAAIACCHYLRCHYFVPLFCGVMPFMVGVFGMVFSISLASLTAMTDFRFSFVYNSQGWWIFFMGLADFLVSLLLLGGFFAITCKSKQNETIDTKATYPIEGFFKASDRSAALGEDFWTCKHEFCILMWINVVVCTPVFVFILLNVVINGWANHDTPLPCYKDQMVAQSSSALLLSNSSFTSLASAFSYSLSSSSPHMLGDGLECKGPYLTPNCTPYKPREWKRVYNWESLDTSGSCDQFLNSAEKYSLGLRHVSKDDYTTAACTASTTGTGTTTGLSSSSHSSFSLSLSSYSSDTRADSGGGIRRDRHRATAAFRRISVWLGEVLHIRARSTSSSLSVASLSLGDVLVQESKTESERISGIGNGNGNGNGNGSLVELAELATMVSDDELEEGDVNSMLCYDYSKLVAQWKEDIELFGADMCWITGIAMLIPAAPILLVDVILVSIVTIVVSAMTAWCGCICVYYIRAVGLACCGGKEVTDGVEVHGNYIVEYYHIEDYGPDFNWCICCGLRGCCQFIGAFTICVLDCCLRDRWGCVFCD